MMQRRTFIAAALGSIAGAVYGAIFMTLLPVVIRNLANALDSVLPFLGSQLPAVQNAVFGLVIILFLIIEPRGLNRLWERMKEYVRYWPFRY